MSGKPTTEGVKIALTAMDRLIDLAREIDDREHEVLRIEARLSLLRGAKDEATREYRAAMAAMDVQAEGNTGFEARAIAFLAEMRRQVKKTNE